MSLTAEDLTQIRTVVVDAVNDAIDLLVTPRFDEVDARMDGLEGRMDGLEGRMDKFDARMDKLEGRMSQQESAQTETNRRLSSIERTLSSIDARLETLENDVKALYELVGEQAPEFDKAYIKLSTEDKLRTIHTHSLRLAKQLGIEL
jgi:uncharacterized coiled-coil protein SlyX